MQIEGDKVSENTLSSEVLNMASHYLVYNRQVGPARDKTITPITKTLKCLRLQKRRRNVRKLKMADLKKIR